MNFKSAKECYEASLKNRTSQRENLINLIDEVVENGNFQVTVDPLDDDIQKELIEAGYKVTEDKSMGISIMTVSWEEVN